MHAMLKGFIGPLGDDIPSLLAVLLALSLFFSALSFSFNAYNEKVKSFEKLKGAIDISRVVTQDGLITADLATLKNKATPTAMSYGVRFELAFKNGATTGPCGPDWLKFVYLVPYAPAGDLNAITLKRLEICVG
ncbi:MAG: hypothetical protein QXO69_03085 [archaeon]